MIHTALIPWLDPETIISTAGPWALAVICFIVFAETGLLFGFLLPGDTLLVIAGILTFGGVIQIDIWWVCLAIAVAAFLGGEVGYLIGHRFGPRVFERKESGIFSIRNVERTNAFFARFGGLAVILARFVLGYIPPIKEFVQEYIDLILLGAVVLTLIPTLWHYFQSAHKAKKAAEAGEDVVTDHEEAEELVLDPDVFDRSQHDDGDDHRPEQR